jgi:radical SAM superfamily enzyme YgiQ (UPF0313 family)
VKITFIRPNLTDVRSSDGLEPLAFAVLADLTPPDVEVSLVDERLEPVAYDEPTDLVALTVETFTARRAYQIATRFRRRGIPVVMGGYHPTFLPREALQFADAVVVGDAEGLWPQVVADARAGRLRRLYRQPTEPPLAGVMPDRRIFRGKRYPPIRLVQYARGCRFACDFCSIHAFYGQSLRQRPVAEVVAEIETLGRRHVLFVDDNIFVDPPRTAALCQGLLPLGIRWSCQVSIDVARHPELLDLMARSGCTTALVGFESLDPRNLAVMKKQWNLKDGPYADAIRRFREHGIMLNGQFVFGYDYDTPDAIERAVDFALESRLYMAGFNPLTPMPGTRLYDRTRAEGRLRFERWWLDPDFRGGQAVFHPRRMTAAQLEEGCFRAKQRFNAWGALLGRALDFRANSRTPYRLGIFLLANLISRREIYRKQGRPLGDGTPLEPVPEPVVEPELLEVKS